jgi:hypothetical protein
MDKGELTLWRCEAFRKWQSHPQFEVVTIDTWTRPPSPSFNSAHHASWLTRRRAFWLFLAATLNLRSGQTSSHWDELYEQGVTPKCQSADSARFASALICSSWKRIVLSSHVAIARADRNSTLMRSGSPQDLLGATGRIRFHFRKALLKSCKCCAMLFPRLKTRRHRTINSNEFHRYAQ